MGSSESIFATYLSGSPVCELASADILDRDLFVLSRQSGDFAQSRSFSYLTLLQQLSSDMLSDLSVGSMAFQNKWKYAKADHNHDGHYTAFGVSYTEPESTGKVQIASISVGSGAEQVIYGVWAPQIEISASVTPEIGTLRFVYSKKTMDRIENEDLASDDWDGWAYPDGSTYEVDPVTFAKALAVYGVDATHITLPSLDEFFSAQPAAVADVQEVLTQSVPVENHTHSIGSLNFSGELKMSEDSAISTYSGSSKSDIKYAGRVHYGKDTWDSTGDVAFTMDLGQVQFKELSCGDCAGCTAEGEFRPRNIRLPVMIYIGGVT